MHKALVGGFAIATLIAIPAMAADLPVKQPIYSAPVAMPFSWTGFYVGGNAGYAWAADPNIASNFSCPAGIGCSVSVPINLANVTAASTGRLSAEGFTGGVQAGYNWQIGGVVLGAEIDFNAFDLKGSRAAVVPSATTPSIFNLSTSIATDWLFTLRQRVGFAVAPTVLLYATGGLAVTKATLANAFFTTNNPANTAAGASGNSKTLTGWTVGGGIEWAFNRNWSLKGEYLYADFGSIAAATAITSPGFANPNVLATSTTLRAHIARAGINYKFDWGGPVVAKY
jgi:outer membrane immunogenic protein